MSGPLKKGKDSLIRALRGRLKADLGDLHAAILCCRKCPGGGGGLTGLGTPGARFLLVAGSPGPGALRENPWGEKGKVLVEEIEEAFPGVDLEELYCTLALRCPGVKVSLAALRRCSLYLAEEVHLVGPKTVIAFGRPAAVALRMALGEDLPANPWAGEDVILQGKRFVYNLDVSKLGDREMGEVFRKILRSALHAP